MKYDDFFGLVLLRNIKESFPDFALSDFIDFSQLECDHKFRAYRDLYSERWQIRIFPEESDKAIEAVEHRNLLIDDIQEIQKNLLRRVSVEGAPGGAPNSDHLLLDVLLFIIFDSLSLCSLGGSIFGEASGDQAEPQLNLKALCVSDVLSLLGLVNLNFFQREASVGAKHRWADYFVREVLCTLWF